METLQIRLNKITYIIHVIRHGSMSSFNYACIQEQKYSAGILPYTIMNNTIYFLLGKDKYEKSWADFGGKVERVDNNVIAATASREFHEETLGVVVHKDYMFELLNLHESDNVIQSKTLNGSPYYMYVVQIPYCKSYRTHFIKAVDSLCFATNNNQKVYKNIEKCDLRWTSINTIKACLNDGNNLQCRHDAINDGRTIRLRNVYYNTMQQNMDKIEALIRLSGVKLS